MALAAFINSPTGPMTTHFWGPIANWGLAASGMYDAALKGPEIINERMSATQILYSGLFVRFAWAVQPRNYILASCHTANVLAQGNQLRRWGEYKIQTEPETGPSTVRNAGIMAAGAAAGIAAMVVASTPVQNSLKGGSGFLARMASHPAGPFYIHFWAPNFKWALSINNLMDYDRPTDKISLSMTSALTLTGLIFMRWSFVITPVNYSLFAVNCALSSSSGYLLARKVKADYFDK
ncbi:MPC1 [Symbiodinium necroappetens]|uniref:Mitochondrial pyruvate carrier n=1 Tax=Symbiodinium necroappetens TaxID=1628268 RepID=A0A812LSC0_9DINO|nr:MPC1 [Symbiodinium necroappetens]|mmetsp:Transcript_13281/g.31499  ORF Transcript_13281/g.31499 Transcript_13281/m.31499 type:complete len:236 (+) Transcript_13281:48-755(+)